MATSETGRVLSAGVGSDRGVATTDAAGVFDAVLGRGAGAG